MQQLTVQCPVCGVNITAEVKIDPGTPAVTSGPSDSWYPGDPPEVSEIVDIIYDCPCRELSEDASAYESCVENVILNDDLSGLPYDDYLD